jgi:hypothetical protein
MKKILTSLAVSALLCSTLSALAIEKRPWKIQCFATDGDAIHVRAISTRGKSYPIVAIPTSDPNLLDVKAIGHNHKQWPVVILKNSKTGQFDVKAIGPNNEIIHVKGVVWQGKTLDIKGSQVSTNLYNIDCITDDDERLGVKAVSPTGHVVVIKDIVNLPNEKGIRIEITAHVKAVPEEPVKK